MSQTLLEMAKDLVFAQIKVQRLSPEDMHTALHATYTTLQVLYDQEASWGSGAVESPAKPPQPINWRKSITKQAVICLVCGASFKQLSVRHLMAHGLDSRSYRERYGIPRHQPLSARAMTARRKQIAQQSRPWEKAPTYVKAHKKTQQPAAKKTRRGKANESETASVVGPPKRVSRKKSS